MIEVKILPDLVARDKSSHKGNYGRVLIIAGSAGMIGAACLATRACLRSGAGLVTLAVPDSQLSIVSIKLTCAMTRAFPEKEGCFDSSAANRIIEFSNNMDVVAIGPGLSTHPATIALVVNLVEKLKQPLVIDADALNAISTCPEVLKKRQSLTILTPHPGEFSRLCALNINEIKKDQVGHAGRFAEKYQCIVVLKFAPTIVCDVERYYVNTTGNPGMATGGTGDVLTGVIAALLAQKYSPFAACQLAVHSHGLAGDLACKKLGEMGMIAEDILDHLPKAFQELQH